MRLTRLTLQVNNDRQQQEQNQESNEASTQQLEQQQRQQAASPTQVSDSKIVGISAPSSHTPAAPVSGKHHSADPDLDPGGITRERWMS